MRIALLDNLLGTSHKRLGFLLGFNGQSDFGKKYMLTVHCSRLQHFGDSRASVLEWEQEILTCTAEYVLVFCEWQA